MNNLIQQELTVSHQYMLKKEVVSGKELIALTPDNVARVLAMLYTDSSYRNSMNPQNEKSMAGRIVKLSNEIDRNNVKTDTISSVVKAINRDNGTHLNADKCGINEITERLSKLTIEDWNVGLSGYNQKMSNEKTLIEYISEKTRPIETDGKGKPYKGRKNLSFASKFCHFMCFFRYNNEPARDNFMIWDSVIVKTLPEYLRAYGINGYNLERYDTYMEAVNALLAKIGNSISRHGLDQLLWYSHK